MNLRDERSAPRAAGLRRTPPPCRPLHLPGTEPWRATAEWLQLRLQLMRSPHPLGDGHPVGTFPGLASDGRVVTPLRNFCRLGHVALDWGRGFNTGPQRDVDRWLRALADDVQRLLCGHGQAPTLIGWRLGGLDARELARLPGVPVRQLITIGAPFNGSPPEHRRGLALPPAQRPAHGQRAAGARPAPAPVHAAPVSATSTYRRSGGVVAGQACRHPEPTAMRVQDIEVEGSLMGTCLALPGCCAAGPARAGPTPAHPQEPVMENQGPIGGLIALWILGAPFLLALFELFTTPRPTGLRTREPGAGARSQHPPDSSTAHRTVAPGRL